VAKWLGRPLTKATTGVPSSSSPVWTPSVTLASSSGVRTPFSVTTHRIGAPQLRQVPRLASVIVAIGT
jgi:hypothetical protein